MSSSTRFRTEGSPAPGRLLIAQGFLNTQSEELGIEDLASPAAANTWLKDAGLLNGRLSDPDHSRLIEFRAQLREAVLEPTALETLFAETKDLPFTLRYGDPPRLEPRDLSGADQVIAGLMAIVYDATLDGTMLRFKCCAYPTCGWAYYDTTRSRTRRWCSMKTCGSRHKARTYYERHR